MWLMISKVFEKYCMKSTLFEYDCNLTSQVHKICILLRIHMSIILRYIMEIRIVH